MKLWKWIKKNWMWILGVFGVIGTALTYRELKRRGSRRKLIPVSNPTNWQTIPGVDNKIVAINPHTKQPETVDLPPGVKVGDLKSVGLSRTGLTYEVETLHRPIDRHGPSAPDSDLGI